MTAALVVGEALIDVVDVPGQPLQRTPGGSPFNVAIGLARFEIPTALLACVGDDADGDLLLNVLEEAGVSFVGERGGTTSTAFAELDEDGSATYAFALEWDPHFMAGFESDALLDVVHVGSVGAFLRPGCELVDRLLDSQPARLRSFDPNIRPALVGSREAARHRVESIAGHVEVVKLSDEDASWLYPDVEVDEVISSLLALGPHLVALTRGAEGSVIATRRHRIEVPAPRVEVVDTIGAGDAYMSALLGALIAADAPARGLAELPAAALRDVGAMASRAAAFVVGRAGSHPPTFDQLRT